MPRRCSNVSRVPSESRIYTWTGNRYFGSSKTSPAIGSLLLPPHSPVRVTSCLCAYHRGQARDTQYLEQQMPVFGALRPAEVVFRSLRYTVTGPSRSLSRGSLAISRWAGLPN
jgi:hypothetical protein